MVITAGGLPWARRMNSHQAVPAITHFSHKTKQTVSFIVLCFYSNLWECGHIGLYMAKLVDGNTTWPRLRKPPGWPGKFLL